MTINSSIEIITSIAETLTDVKSIFDKIPVNLFLPPNKKKLTDLKDKISLLENKINTGFPKLASLIRFYSRLISDVRIAGALSDKMAELYGLVPEIGTYTTTFTSSLQSDYSRISSSINQINSLDVEEKGSLDRILVEIRDQIQNLKRVSTNEHEKIKEILQKISTQYSDMESILSSLLEKILASFNQLS
ncbi:MAG TPA: hypothetical protein DCF68_09700 [Cyanothece sp. UBA12306]|nr:hypothetical protein [Cyanothece sp. UBA12306]